MSVLSPPDRQGFVPTAGGDLRLWEWGDPARPRALLLHGASDHGRLWEGGIPTLLGLGLGVAAIDLRGHGDSTAAPSTGGMVAELDVLAAIRHLGPPVGIVAHSLGGRLALSAAAAMPELVRWIVTIEGLGATDGISDPENAIASMLRRIHREAGALEGGEVTPGRAYATLHDMERSRGRVNPRIPRAWMRHLVAHGHRPRPGGDLAWKGHALRIMSAEIETVEEIFSLVRCPILVITGEEPDQWGMASEPTQLERVSWLANAEHRTVPGAGHYPHLERPELVWSYVRDFLGGLP